MVDIESIEQNSTTTASTTSVSSDEKSEDLVDEAPSSYIKRRPSQQLTKAIFDITGSGNIGEKPDKKVMNTLGSRSQLLKFEYIGLFPFSDISPLLMTSSNDNANRDQVKILMVAEKPSIAQESPRFRRIRVFVCI